jgi:hypothetical protein
VAYLFQVVAFDHWRVDPAHDVTGVTGSQEHVIHENHCHGDGASCADSGGGMAYVKFAEVIALPLPSSVIVGELIVDAPLLTGTSAKTLTPPPRAA